MRAAETVLRSAGGYTIIQRFERLHTRVDLRAVTTPARAIEPLGYQVQPITELLGTRHFILNMPTGYGKTTILIFLAIRALLRDPLLRVVITVPQRIIGSGFTEERAYTLEGYFRDQTWCPFYNLCGRTTEKKVEQVIRFLKLSAGQRLASRVLVTTHATMVAAYETLGSAEVRRVFTDLVLVVDEAHHVQSSELEDLALQEIDNQLGRIVKHLLRLDDPNVTLWGATATFHRADNLPIFGASVLRRFRRYHVPFDEYWATLRHLREFSSYFVIYDGMDPFPAYEELLRSERVPTLVYCPQENSRWLCRLSKEDFHRGILRALRRHYTGSRVWEPGDSGGHVIVDLVSMDMGSRRKAVEFIHANRHHPEAIDAILTCGMMKEGADWPAVRRVIDFSPSLGSVAERCQKFGRGTRDLPGKTGFDYYTFLPRMTDVDGEIHRVRCAEYLGQMVAALVDLNYYCPTLVWVTEPTGKGRPPVRRQTDILGSYPMQEQERILQLVTAEVIRMNTRAELDRVAETRDDYLLAIRAGLVQAGVTEHLEDLALQVYEIKRKHALAVLRSQARFGMAKLNVRLDVSPVDIGKADLAFAGAACGLRTFVDMKQRLLGENFYATLAEASAAAIALGGIVTEDQYVARRLEDPLLPSDPRTYYRDEWVSWPHFLGRQSLRREGESVYGSYQEAASGVRGLVNAEEVKRNRENLRDLYSRVYRRDPRLPSNPGRQYKTDWNGWPPFFGVGPEDGFCSYEEAQRLLVEKGVRGETAYRQLLDNEPRLPRNPHIYYQLRNEWRGWKEFCRGVARYGTWQECAAAAGRLGIGSAKHYFARYSEDPSLPSKPNECFADFPGWDAFFGKETVAYYSFEELKRVCVARGITTAQQYFRAKKDDPRMPSQVEKHYGIGFRVLFGRELHGVEPAAAVCRKHGVRSKADYRRLRSRDRALPHNPERVYDMPFSEFLKLCAPSA